MPVYATKGSLSIPEGAVRMSRDEVLDYQKSFVQKWKTESDVLFLKYGKFIAGCCSAVTSVVAWTHCRPFLNLGSKGRLLPFLPGTLVPVCATFICFDKMVTEKVLLMENQCPLCNHLKHGLLQTFNNVIYPAVIGVVSGSGVAIKYNTAYVPDPFQAKELYKFYISILKPGALKFQLLIATNLFLCLFLPYMQSKELVHITKKVESLEYSEELETDLSILN